MIRAAATEAELGDRALSALMRSHAALHTSGRFLTAIATLSKTMTTEAPKWVGNKDLHVFTHVVYVQKLWKRSCVEGEDKKVS